MPWNQSLSEFDSSATTAKEEQTAETTPRAWWLTEKERTVYKRGYTIPRVEYLAETAGFDETISYLHDYLLNNPPFDVSYVDRSTYTLFAE